MTRKKSLCVDDFYDTNGFLFMLACIMYLYWVRIRCSFLLDKIAGVGVFGPKCIDSYRRTPTFAKRPLRKVTNLGLIASLPLCFLDSFEKVGSMPSGFIGSEGFLFVIFSFCLLDSEGDATSKSLVNYWESAADEHRHERTM